MNQIIKIPPIEDEKTLVSIVDELKHRLKARVDVTAMGGIPV